MVNKTWNLMLVGALAAVTLIAVGAIVLSMHRKSTADATNTVVAVQQPSRPQSIAQTRHAELAVFEHQTGPQDERAVGAWLAGRTRPAMPQSSIQPRRS